MNSSFDQTRVFWRYTVELFWGQWPTRSRTGFASTLAFSETLKAVLSEFVQRTAWQEPYFCRPIYFLERAADSR